MSAAARRAVIVLAATEVFAEHGYRGASIDEIARRSGITPPVLYDHFASKQDLHRHLLEAHFAQLRELWRDQLSWDGPPAQRMARALNAWFAYVQSHPYAWRMLFADTSGEPEVEALHRQVAAGSRAALLPLLAGQDFVDACDPVALELSWEVFRGLLQGLALWWYEHQDVPREQLVAAAMNALWIGYERVGAGERWAS